MAFLLFLLAFFCSEAKAQTTPQIIRSLVQVEAFTDEEWTFLGTGSVVFTKATKSHYGILTAAHIAEASRFNKLRACFHDNSCVVLGSFQTGNPTENEVPGDWALFHLRDKPSGTALRLALLPVEMGDRVKSYGWPWGGFKYTEGYVNRKPTLRELSLELYIAPGASGAPVLNKRNNIVCVVSGFELQPYPGLGIIDFPLLSQAHCAIPNF